MDEGFSPSPRREEGANQDSQSTSNTGIGKKTRPPPSAERLNPPSFPQNQKIPSVRRAALGLPPWQKRRRQPPAPSCDRRKWGKARRANHPHRSPQGRVGSIAPYEYLPARPVRDPAKLRCSGRMTTRDAYRNSPESKNGSCRSLKRTASNSASELSPSRLPKWSDWLIRWGRARKAGRDLPRDQFLPTDAMPDTPAVAPAGLASTAPRAADLFTKSSSRNSTTRAAWPGWRGGPSGGIRRGRWRR